jgi:hypothetical protein
MNVSLPLHEEVVVMSIPLTLLGVSAGHLDLAPIPARCAAGGYFADLGSVGGM